jgi:tRNA (adenine-N(1)-)-methyltransferase non-catalytic subunit
MLHVTYPGPQDIIRKQIEQHATYSLKTEYSKEKYKKKKAAKFSNVFLLFRSTIYQALCRYSKTFTALEPSIFNVCEYWFKKDQRRVRDLRIDTLSQMLNMANVKPAGRYIAVDDASGLLVSGILDRLGGKACSP